MKKISSLFLMTILLAACSLPLATSQPATPATSIPPTVTSLPTFPVTEVPAATATAEVTAATATAVVTVVPSATPLPAQDVFAVIGDFGSGDQFEADVATLVDSWKPDFIITVGDDNYPNGAADTIDAHIGQFYHQYIYPYTGSYGAGADQNRFFPTLGNHDWYTTGAKPYLDYFSLPGNERYYDFVWGPVHFFALDSDENEADGVNQASVQAKWLQQAMAASTSRWNVVYFHHAPYTSGVLHGSTTWMRWPFAAWGANVVLTGHEHTYERLSVDGIPYFVNGLGGGGIYNFGTSLPESQFRYNADHGAMLVVASQTEMSFKFFNWKGTLIDSYQLTKP
jgi:tartrate-resistant acid phosphatase type 5